MTETVEATPHGDRTMTAWNPMLAFALLASFPLVAHANAFIPSLLSANVLWAFALPVVVAIEGFLVARSGWQSPYKTSFTANLLSMAAALPLGILITLIAAYFSADKPEGIAALAMGLLLYGQVPGPSYGYLGRHETSEVALAALLFMGLCWLVTWAVEGRYFARRNPSIARQQVYARTAVVNLFSYAVLLLLWLPYSLYSAYEGEEQEKLSCSSWNVWTPHCPQIWNKYPDVRVLRLQSCKSEGIGPHICLTSDAPQARRR